MPERAASTGRRPALPTSSCFHDQRPPFQPLCLVSICVYLHSYIRFKKYFPSFRLLLRLLGSRPQQSINRHLLTSGCFKITCNAAEQVPELKPISNSTVYLRTDIQILQRVSCLLNPSISLHYPVSWVPQPTAGSIPQYPIPTTYTLPNCFGLYLCIPFNICVDDGRCGPARHLLWNLQAILTIWCRYTCVLQIGAKVWIVGLHPLPASEVLTITFSKLVVLV
jgi:hypothetical protein